MSSVFCAVRTASVMVRSTEEESRAGDSHSASSREQDGVLRRSRSPVRRRSKEGHSHASIHDRAVSESPVRRRSKERHSHASIHDRAVSESVSRHRPSQRDLPTVDDRQDSELSRHRPNERDLPTVDDRQSSELKGTLSRV